MDSLQNEGYCRLTKLVNQLDPNSRPQIGWVYRASQRIKGSRKKLGIFSASFNPITVAHIKMIEEAEAHFELEEILLLLAKANVDKSVFGLSLEERLIMLKTYAMSRKNFSVAACSHGRYIDKIEALKAIYPLNTQLSFIVGYDTLVRIFDPKYYTDLHAELEMLFQQCRFIVANRKEYGVDSVIQFLAAPAHQRYASHIDLIELSSSYADLSSTEIRTRIQQGESINHLVPPQVQEYLKTIHAYQS